MTRSTTTLRSTLAIGCVLGGALAGAQAAPSLGAAAKYTVFGVRNTKMTFSSGNTRVNGNVGVGRGSSLNFSGGGIVSGSLDRHPGTSVNLSGGSQVQGGLFDVDMDQATSDALAASSYASGLSATQTFGTLGNGSSIFGNGGLNVVEISSIGLSGGGALALSGAASDYFVLNITGKMELSGGSKINLSGVSLDRVLFNFVGTGQKVNLSGNSTVNGTILAVNRDIIVSGGVVNGSIIGAMDHELKLQSGPTINGPVPEPGTMAVLGLGAAALLRRRRRS